MLTCPSNPMEILINPILTLFKSNAYFFEYP